jgi:MOSC domain-containing protein YiiM
MERMRVVSVNVSLPKRVPYKGRTVSTAIFKEPVTGRIPVRSVGLRGDAVGDPRVHGAPNKAVYGYPSEHYEFWKAELPEMALPWGMFGENLTTQGLLETDVHLGDRYRVGTAVLEATNPRFPCFKLGIRFGREDIEDRFLESGRSGFYFRVVREGEVGAGDPIERASAPGAGPTIADVVRARIEEAAGGE